MMPLLCEFKHPIKPVEYEIIFLVCQDFFIVRTPSQSALDYKPSGVKKNIRKNQYAEAGYY